MSRVQLALNVEDLDAAIDFYGKLFATPPAQLRPGYANFAIDDPALKLVLIAGEGKGGTVNHLGVEVASTDDVDATTRRLALEGLDTIESKGEACCYATQDKVWVHDPDGAPWEVYTVLGDADTMTRIAGPGETAEAACCGETATATAGAATACC